LKRTQLAQTFGKLGHNPGKLRAFRGGNPVQPDPLFFHAELFQHFHHQGKATQSVVIPVGVMAVTRMAAGDEYPVSSLAQGFEDEGGVNPARAHDPHHPQVRRVLQPAHPGQVGAGIAAPVAQKPDYLRFEITHFTRPPILVVSRKLLVVGISSIPLESYSP